MPTKPSAKPHVKLAYGLIIAGMAIFMLERFGLSNMSGPNHTPLHLDGTLLSLMVIAPVALILAGCVTFMVGSMLRRP